MNINNKSGKSIQHKSNSAQITKNRIQAKEIGPVMRRRLIRDEFVRCNKEQEKQARIKAIREREFKARIMAFLTALGISAATITGANAVRINDLKENEFGVTSVIDLEHIIYPKALHKSLQDTKAKVEVEEIEEEVEEEISIDEILCENSELESAYNKIMDALERYSSQLGEDAISLIQNRVDEIGNGEVEALDVAKILWLESRGRIYEDTNQTKILTSNCNAYGAFQLTKNTVSYINDYFGLTGTSKELNVLDPYDNLDACIYNLRFLKEKREIDLINGKNLPTGDSLKNAVIWSYHDGAWATSFSTNGKNYLSQYSKFSVLDDYPEVVEYIFKDNKTDLSWEF
jgi:hypothetical protein